MWKGIQRNFARVVRPRTVSPFRYAEDFPTAKYLLKETNFMKCMKNLTQNSITKLDCGISVVNLGMKLEPNRLSSDLLFVRDFYPDLLEDIRKFKKAILLGNPGISKSYFHHYYLARIMNPSLFGPLPRDFWGSTDPPEIVIRQLCGIRIEVYDISQDTVYKLPDYADIFLNVDYTKSVYLMEPDVIVKQGPYLVDVPTLATVSPDTSRYKGFAKNGAVKFFMPCYTEQELLDIGQYLRGNKNASPPIPSRIPAGMDDEYTEESIKQRIKQFGGIIRHVLPSSRESLVDTRIGQRQAIQEVIDNNKVVHILSAETIEDQRLSHYLAHYQVSRTNEDNKIRFHEPTLEITSQDIRDQLLAELGKFSIQDQISTLIKNDMTNCFQGLTSKMFENVFFQLILSGNGITCQQQELKLFKSGGMPQLEPEMWEKNHKATIKNWAPYSLRLSGGAKISSPPYSDMQCDFLYYPTIENHPFCEFFYKDSKDGTLVVFQLTRQISGPKYTKPSAFTLFLKSIDFPKDHISKKIKLIFVPSPQFAETMSLVVQIPKNPTAEEKEEEHTLDLIENYTILKIDECYNHLFRGSKQSPADLKQL